MSSNGFINYGGANGMWERAPDNFYQQHKSAALNSPMGDRLDDRLGGVSNPSQGFAHGGTPDIGIDHNSGGVGGHHQQQHHHHHHHSGW